jgi:hypothetical protein
MMEAIAEHAPGNPVTFPTLQAKYPKLEKNLTVEEIYSIISEKQQGGGGGGEGPKGDGPETECDPDENNEPDQSDESGDDESPETDSGESEDDDGGDDQTREDDSGKGPAEDDEDGDSSSGDEDADEDSEFDKVGGGSGADGDPRDYEEEPNDNWETFQEDKLLEAIEQKIEEEEQERGIGTIPGELKRVIKNKLRPQPNPWDVLRSTVAKAIANSRGAPDSTYRRMSRRQSIMPDDTRLKGQQRYSPSAACVIDTSGSMTSECLAKALVVVQQGLKAIGKLPVITCDARVTGDRVLTAVSQDFVLAGGGGTDMRVPIAHAEKEYRPDVIVLVTDGYTPWPSKPTKGQLIVACTTDCQGIPPWAKTVRIPNAPNKEEL